MSGQLKTACPRLCTNSDRSYFSSYAEINIHEKMLRDRIRTDAYKKAIFALGNLIKNKVVLDVGAGTGILSCFCAQAGARKVYAVEASGIAQEAKKIVSTNGLQNQVEVIQKVLEDVELPEKVDLIVSEWMGNCLLYESMLPSVLTARDRWLKPEGILIPCSATLYLAPVSDDEVAVDKVNFWKDLDEVYGVNFTSILPFARRSICKEVMVKIVPGKSVLAKPEMFSTFNIGDVTQKEIDDIQHNFSFTCLNNADFQGFAVWFDCGFTSENMKGKGDEKQLELSTSPQNGETHWKQSVLYLDNEVAVKKDTKISGSISFSPGQESRRFLSIELSYNVDDGKSSDKSYVLGYG